MQQFARSLGRWGMQSESLVNSTLGAICERQGGAIQTGPFGSQLHASDYTASGTPVVMPADIAGGRVSTSSIARVGPEHVERLSQHQLRLNDIVFSRRGDVTRFARVTPREVGWLCGTGCLKVRVGTGDLALPQWISLALGRPEVKEWLVRHAVGATMPNLNSSILGALPIQVPPIERQREAVEVLFALDERIDLLRQANATLESIAQAVFKSWFVDFDPVRAKAEGREPEVIDAATAALFPSGFKESSLGLIPNGWQAAQVGDVLRITMGQSPPGDTYNQEGNGLPFYQGRADFGFRFPAVRVHCTAPTRFAQAGDVLISVRAPVGDVNVALEACAVGRGVAAVSLEAAPSFALYSMKALRERFAEFESHGTIFGSINKKQFEALPCVFPTVDVLEAFSQCVGPLDERLRINELQMRGLTEVRDALLPRLVSGKLRLPEAQAQLAEALA